MKDSLIPPRDPLVARTTDHLLRWAHILLDAAHYGRADLVFAYDDVIKELNGERTLLREEHFFIRYTASPPPLTDRPTAPPRTDTLPSPAPMPVIVAERPRRPPTSRKPKRRKARRRAA